jgi:predicted nucleic acid-binding protein
VSRLPVVVDTNVVVAGLMTGTASCPMARILDGTPAAAFPFVVSEALLAEYRALLARPALRRLRGLAVAEIETLLTDLVLHAVVLAPGLGPPAPDRGDRLLWDLLAARPDLLLVTGDKALQRDAVIRSRVVSPQAFVELP